MSYTTPDWYWVDDQLDKAGHTQHTATRRYIKGIIHSLVDNEFLNKELYQVEEVFTTALSLFKGQPVFVDDSDIWLPAVSGEIAVRDVVRIRPDAYTTGANASKHNGRRGRVVSMRNGNIGVLYDGEEVDSASLHKVEALEKLDVK